MIEADIVDLDYLVHCVWGHERDCLIKPVNCILIKHYNPIVSGVGKQYPLWFGCRHEAVIFPALKCLLSNQKWINSLSGHKCYVGRYYKLMMIVILGNYFISIVILQYVYWGHMLHVGSFTVIQLEIESIGHTILCVKPMLSTPCRSIRSSRESPQGIVAL